MPPHLRNKSAVSSADAAPLNDRDQERGGESRGPSRGGSAGGNYIRGGGSANRDSRDSRDSARSADFSNFNTRNKRDNFPNGETSDDRDRNERDWGSRGGSRGFSDRERERDLPRNDRWQEPERGGSAGAGRWNDSRSGSRGGNDADWTIPTARDERIELDLFGAGNTGINFSKYEDIPVEATGDEVPPHITTVRYIYIFFYFNLICIHLIPIWFDLEKKSVVTETPNIKKNYIY